MTFNPVTHVLFDLDGLLIDSEKVYTQSYTEVCARYNKQFTWEIHKTFLGFLGHECADTIIRVLDLPVSREEFMEQCREVNEKLFPSIKLMPGARRLIEHLHKHSVPMALATSSAEDNVYKKMSSFMDILDKFHHKTMGSTDPDVKKGKPDPSIFLVCASRFPDKPNPESCLVFEDAVNGVKAGLAANMQVVVVPDPRIDKTLVQDATLVLQSLEDFKPELFNLPAFD